MANFSVNTWVGVQYPRYLRQDLLSSDDERKRLKLTLQSQEQDRVQ